MRIVDIHSHILPNMDDGSHSIRQSMEMLRIASGQGIGRIFATPHHMPGKGCPEPDSVYERIEKLQATADEEGIPIKILPGMEYYYREEVLELLEEDAVVTLNGSGCVLVEFEPMAEKAYIRNALRGILGMGYTPVVAHVERYARVMEDAAFLAGLKKMRILLQINAASVTGGNGRQARKAVGRLLKAQLADFVATDAHSDGRRAPCIGKCAELLVRKYGKEYADALLFGNAEEYLMKGMG